MLQLPQDPTIKKFFSNKIESSLDTWGEYLLEVADIFSSFDGEELDRDRLTERFQVLSGRSPYALRDQANFRDEFGAYGTYLGVFRVELKNGKWHIFLSKAARKFLCSPEPDVETFCRLQMSLFQYPNGAGVVYNNNGTMRVQTNAKNDTMREISNGVRIAPFRLACRIVVCLHELLSVQLEGIFIPYKLFFVAMNDTQINTKYKPSFEALVTFITDYRTSALPSWVTLELTNFKRNFHIFEQTGLFVRSKDGLKLNLNTVKCYEYVKYIAEMDLFFKSFESCYHYPIDEQKVVATIEAPDWGMYYDAANISLSVLANITEASFDSGENILYDIPETKLDEAIPFPDFKLFTSLNVNSFISSNEPIDSYATLIKREKAHREHARILNMLVTQLKLKGWSTFDNVFIDLYAQKNNINVIYEVKSNAPYNTLSQIRKGLSQLYEYRYRAKLETSILVLILQTKPMYNWVIDYLVNDRGIYVCWLSDDISLDCPLQCKHELSKLDIL